MDKEGPRSEAESQSDQKPALNERQLDDWLNSRLGKLESPMLALEQFYEGGPIRIIEIRPPSFASKALARITGSRPRNRERLIDRWYVAPKPAIPEE